MPAFLTFDRISAARPDGGLLFSDLSLAIGREAVGLVGRNGSGKSTLLAIAAGLAAPLSGDVTPTGRVGFLRQIQPDAGAIACALGVEAPLAAMARLEAGEGTAQDAALAEWDLPERLDAVLSGIGLAGLDLARDVAGLSGGERTRLAIAALLLDAPDLLLLDEPTNNLDREGREAVLALLRGWQGGALVASHDRELLEEMDQIVALSPVGITLHGGGWGDFVEARDAARVRAETELDCARRTQRQQVQRARQREEAQARRDRAGRARSERGGEPKILLGALKRRAEASAGALDALAERQSEEARALVEQARSRVEVITPLSIDLPPSGLSAGRRLLALRDVVLEVDGKPILGPVSFEITGPERVALSGPNGSGKTSLLRIVLGEIEPTLGEVFRAPGAIAMLDQHAALLDPGASLIEAMMARHPGMTRHDAHAALARFAFRNREAERIAGTLSGGERLRAALALVCSGNQVPQLLVLDEPTNHLDLEAVEELERALQAYDGAMLVVSHDPAFLSAIGIGREIVLAKK
ncbi:ABC-F family ATP-binding cassette domain-containing protein [Altererythrobacter sp. CC-YST694]|uniref:ATP-binding cassette domain-containing protein n=1 Tax=Altererythrobacter sp. CC-YST694 TaxID=2755038 RepID=UPI001D01A896|nr:ATP-binding cassette domain-containing protein [Altererythrobacter sp. CC-YST694]MCB5424860.1 ABC-F family ATP-binding cassette domain-containing protein [Altererythrobacter sp. CC-YST694]